ncbi:MAG: 3-oxoacyl-[acyl-carrier-protein] reductase [Kordiimonadaceae bacterium]|jgi:3-oxoacyl-[acyl-carrier protein] reductase|nr:3-oxoacyl-[acyl-carrier-protein] reductase [Kordiimonadaceae bacterium]MBT6036323.1 3-oxoacyl-[acyl-carrier-protein] reductase [Kordiimonadaceae bacterium]MBT6328700.1 3-oxoacyl-[acyl-carrier-protein] reductase [Kordiimonadaceae bacterium]
MFDLTGKCALVTGASGGLGSSIARALHGAGAKVALSGTREEPLKALAAELGEGAYVVPANLSDPTSVAALPKAAIEAMGSIDILVNNAGITRDNISMRLKDADWDDVMQVNLKAAFNLTQGVMRGMMKKRTGRIINITSIVGVTGNPGQVNYAASKAGMIGMSKSFAHELASRNITVNCIAPGFIESPMTDGLSDDQKNSLLVNVPAGRLGKANEVAAGVLYLASDQADYVTGQTLHINGGMAMI